MTAMFCVSAFAQSTTTTILINWNPTPCQYFQGTRNVPFTDTAGSNWSYLKVRMPLGAFPEGSATVSIAINGVPVGDPVIVGNTGTACGPYPTYEFGVASLAGYHAYAQNTFTINSVGGHAGNTSEPAELTFTTEPRQFAFDLLPSMSEKLLIHKRVGDTYPSAWQVETGLNERPRFRFRGAVTSSTASLDADVWLRVVDPPDPSPYLPAHSADDNRDPSPKGVLMTSNCADPSCRAAPGDALQIHATSGGVVELELEATDRYAGDNYILEASFDPQFTCATAGANRTNLCAQSGLVTAWKRMYVESDQMFTAGAMIKDNVVPCVGNSCPPTTIVHVDDATPIAHANQLRFIHAPRYDGQGSPTFYYEDVTVVRVNRHDNTVEV
ncbi:MAG TPA: hypothetical protein VG323_15950, partial [Thermoanaerobaculia bacterium]|nr:hypothetical protein [Thermoanaerobaculia bacterium]